MGGAGPGPGGCYRRGSTAPRGPGRSAATEEELSGEKELLLLSVWAELHQEASPEGSHD